MRRPRGDRTKLLNRGEVIDARTVNFCLPPQLRPRDRLVVTARDGTARRSKWHQPVVPGVPKLLPPGAGGGHSGRADRSGTSQ
jgi:hypothetical protein